MNAVYLQRNKANARRGDSLGNLFLMFILGPADSAFLGSDLLLY